jgi:alpha-L-fucosidase 2
MVALGLALLSALAARAGATQSPDSLTLWYRKPAARWNEALPIGNGRLGAMVFGGTAQERIQLNEETLWSGGPYDPVVPGASRALPEIRRLLFAGEVAKAHDLFGRTMMGVPYEQMKYQSLGELVLRFPKADSVADYRRALDLDRATVTVSYRVGEVRYTREAFVSAPDQALVIRISADRPGAVSFGVELHGSRNDAHSNYGTDYFQMDGVPSAGLRLTGKSSTYLGVPGRLTYQAELAARTSGGRAWTDYRTLRVEGADTAVLVLAAATSFVDYRTVGADPAERVRAVLAAIEAKPVGQILEDHLREHRGWFRRVSLTLGSRSASSLPTDERLARLTATPDPDLLALYYQYGRYLLIASSRPGTEPANLQGIWNDSPNPWWDSKYTVNINLPMNYWPAESGNLGELVGPLEKLVREVAVAGARTAREHWGAGGWVLHQNTDLWRSTTPMDGPSWGAWPVGGAWLVTNLFEHYRFGVDRAYLESIYPLIRGQVEFLLDILVEHPTKHWLVTAPSNSPENFPGWPGNGEFFDEVSGITLTARTMSAGPTMDNQIIREVLALFGEAAQVLGRDSALAARAATAATRLPPNQIGRHGQIQEWLDDWPEIEPEHRHLSPLWGLYPGSEITPEKTPALATAAAVTIRRRGTGGCGWSYGWRAGLWARLGKGEEADRELRGHLARSSLPNLFSLCGRALQIDGNLGATAAIAEMLLQSHQGRIDLLPALPTDWSEGAVTGLRARGAVLVDLAWRGGRLTMATLRPARAGRITVRAEGLTAVRLNGRPIRVQRSDPQTIQFEALAGAEYRLESTATRPVRSP